MAMHYRGACNTMRHDTKGAGEDMLKGLSVQVGDMRLMVTWGHKVLLRVYHTPLIIMA